MSTLAATEAGHEATEPAAVELPVPPLRIRRITLHGVGPEGARFDPLDLDLSTSTGAASRVLLSLTNTGGKSTLITLLSNLVLPVAKAQIGGRQVGDYVLTNDTSHVVMEWEDAANSTRFVIGVVMEWANGGRQPAESQRGADNMNRRWYTFRTGDGLPGIDDLPFIVDGRRTPWDRFIAELKELFVDHPGARGAVAVKQHEWAATLESHTSIDPVLFRYQMRMNDDEAGAEALLGSFNSPESVVRFFVDAFSDEQELSEFAGRLTKYAELAATRPELEALSEFCAALLPRIEAVTERAAESAANDTELRRAEIAGDELVAAIAARIRDDTARLSQLEADTVAAAEETAGLRRDEGRVSDIRLQLRLVRARAAAEAAEARAAETKGRSEELDAERAAWEAVEDVLRVDEARGRWEHTKQALEAADAGLAPLRDAADLAAARFAARLDTLIAEAVAAAEAADAAAAAADELFETSGALERAAAARRIEAHGELRAAEAKIAAAAAAADSAAADGWLDPNESPHSGLERWTVERDTATTAVATAGAAALEADTRFDELSGQRRSVDNELVGLRSAAQRADTELARFDTDFGVFAGVELLDELLGGPAADPDDLERAATLARNAAKRCDARAAEHLRIHTELAAELEHLDSTGTAPAGPDTMAVHQSLIDAGIGASTGLEWVERNIVDTDQRRAFIETHSAVAGGVIVNDPARFRAAVDVLDTAALHTRTPVTVSTPPNTGADDEGPQHQLVVVPHRGTWDREWAARRRDELAGDVASESEHEAAARANAEEYRQLCSQLDTFHSRWHGVQRASLVEAAAGAAEALDVHTSKLAALESEMGELRGAAAGHRADAEAARAAESHAGTAIVALTNVVELAAEAATAETALDALDAAVRTAGDEELAARTAAAAARAKERDHLASAGRYRREASAMRSERAAVGGAAAVDDTGENLDTLRGAWESLRQELRAATAGMVEAEAHQRAGDDLAQANRRLGSHPDAAVARAGVLAGSLEAASPEARRAAVAGARRGAEEARAELLRAQNQVEVTAEALRKAQPTDPQHPNFADLDSTPEWKPAAPTASVVTPLRRAAPSADMSELRVALLVTPGSGTASCEELVDAHRRLGHDVTAVDAAALTATVGAVGVAAALDVDVVHSRVSAHWAWGLQAAIEGAGHLCVNDLAGVVAGRDKWACHLALAAAGIATPDTTLLVPGGDGERAAAAVGSYPVVVKECCGHSGTGVRLAHSGLVAAADRALIVQRFYAEAAGVDLRVDVTDGRVAARWWRRASVPGEFRANQALGGTCSAAACDPTVDEIAISAAAACGLTLAGVDVLITDDGPVVVEVNTNAGVADAVAVDGRPVAAWHAEAVAAVAGRS